MPLKSCEVCLFNYLNHKKLISLSRTPNELPLPENSSVLSCGLKIALFSD